MAETLWWIAKSNYHPKWLKYFRRPADTSINGDWQPLMANGENR
jgi:hypothetical protein